MTKIPQYPDGFTEVEKIIIERLDDIPNAVPLRKLVYEGDKKISPASYEKTKNTVMELIDMGIVHRREVENYNAKALYYLDSNFADEVEKDG